jgi:hypothetical protein
MDKKYADALAHAKKELATLTAEKFSIDAKIARLQASIKALSAMTEEEISYGIALEAMNSSFLSEMGKLGITDAIRAVLRESKMSMTAPQIRDALKAGNYDISDYSNALTVIHNTIKRMEKQGEISEVTSPTGSLGWMLKAK